MSTPRNLEIDRHVKALGAGGKSLRIRRSVGSPRKAIKDRVNAIIDKMIELGQIDVLEAFASDQITAAELIHADRERTEGRLTTLGDIRLSRRLWDRRGERGAVSLALRKMPAGKTRGRYETSMAKLKKVASKALEKDATLRQLDKLDWRQLHRNWESSPSDWMHIRRAVSRILTLTLESEHHPFRLSVVAKIPTMKENERNPRMSPEQFESVMAHVREDVVDAFWTLLGTGIRLGEFLALRPSHLDGRTRTIQVPGTKTRGSKRPIQVNPEFWPHIERSVARMRIGESGLRKIWRQACDAAEVEYITIHDIRHLNARWAIDGGAPDSRVQDALGHATSAMTRRYSRSVGTAEVSDAIVKVVKKQGKIDAVETAGSR